MGFYGNLIGFDHLVGCLEHDFYFSIFSIYGNVIIPSDKLIFFGRSTSKQLMSSPDKNTGCLELGRFPKSGAGLQADAQQEALSAVKRAWKAERGREGVWEATWELENGTHRMTGYMVEN